MEACMVPAADVSVAVLDASFIVGFCAKEPNKFPRIKAKLDFYAAGGWLLFAPGVVSGEVMYALCKKRTDEGLPEDEYRNAVAVFAELMKEVHPPPDGEASLVRQVGAIQDGYGCSRMSDAFYLALAERLQTQATVEVVTTDAGMRKHAATRTPSVNVELLPVTP